MTEPTEAQIEAGAKACYASYSRNRVAEWDDIEDDHRALYRRDARAVLTAAFAVESPVPDENDLAGRERALVYRSDPVALYAYPVAESVLFVEEINGGPSHRLFIPAMYCDAMIEALLAGKPEREKRLAFLKDLANRAAAAMTAADGRED